MTEICFAFLASCIATLGCLFPRVQSAVRDQSQETSLDHTLVTNIQEQTNILIFLLVAMELVQYINQIDGIKLNLKEEQ